MVEAVNLRTVPQMTLKRAGLGRQAGELCNSSGEIPHKTDVFAGTPNLTYHSQL